LANLNGLDLGSRSLKSVSLARVKNGYSLVSLAHQEIPFQDEDVPREQVASEALTRFVKEGGVKSRDVVVALSGEFVNIRTADVPKMPADELRNVLSYDIESYIPVNRDESVVDFQIVGDSKVDPTKMTVIIAAGRLESAEALYKLTNSVKLKAVAIDIDELALANMFEVNYAWEDDYKKTICLINIGNRMTSLLIFDEGILRFVRPITIAGEVFTKDIQREFSLKAEQAEDLKREQGKIVIEDSSSFSLTMFDREDRSLRIYETISSSLNKLLAEIKRCFDYYDTQYKGKTIERILISGGGVKLRNLDRHLQDKLSIQVDLADPFRQIHVGSKGPMAGIIEANSPSFAVSVGLALRKFA